MTSRVHSVCCFQDNLFAAVAQFSLVQGDELSHWANRVCDEMKRSKNQMTQEAVKAISKSIEMGIRRNPLDVLRSKCHFWLGRALMEVDDAKH